jgi:mono/diheme cytochrome c family protein
MRTSLLIAALCAMAPFARAGDPAEYFESRVRPVLAEHCWKCHGSEKQFAGLRLDSRQAVLNGGDSGPALEPGDPDASLIIEAVRQSDDVLKMPPKGKLSDEAVQALSDWVKMGAPWPDTPAATSAGTSAATAHWAFQPVRKPPVPPSTGWSDNPIDAFIARKLEAAGLAPSPEADRRTLLRRVTFDLTGLPPTEAETAAFLNDHSPDAYARLVDRLLASPRYGERWGRHWLDVARYSDSKGYVFQEERRFPYSYTYRDWVIRALNEDMPYDRFVICQLAADRLGEGADRRDLAAMGFLTLGRRFLNVQDDIIDDRIDVTTRGLLGLTVACARCHDHKYDPIPSEDYYSLYGIFASSEEPKELPLIGDDKDAAAHAEYLKKREERKREVEKFTAQKHEELRKDLSDRAEAYVKAALDIERNPRSPKLDERARADHLRPETLRFVAGRLAGRDDAKDAAGDPSKIRAWLEAPDGPLAVGEADLRRLLNRADRNELRQRERQVAELDANDPNAPPRGMVLVDRERPVDPYVFIRGNPGRRGPSVPRRFLKVLSGPERPAYTQGSGRLELARAIASPENPLTARVMVNRIWMHHFGQGIVRSPSDFGTRSDPPSHPDLLDWLAGTFVERGWSVKAMHRLIVLSRTYRQQSLDRPDGQARDPQNLLLWKQNRRRLEFEALRDSVLAVSGQLDETIGGRPVPLFDPKLRPRRTVYAFIDRQNLDGAFRTFDLASPDASTPKRFVTTVPQQALFLMNHPFLAEAARRTAALPELAEADTPAQRVELLYQRIFNRAPDPNEVSLGLAYVESPAARAEGSSLGPWEQYAQVLLMSNEFTYID